MRNILFYILILFCFSCKEEQKSNADFTDEILNVVIEKQTGESIEFQDLYDKLVDNIPEDRYEKLKIVQKLKSRGFKIIDWGRGNFPPLGPRIINMKLRKGTCECEVSKIYYSTISENEYRTTEIIRCQKIENRKVDSLINYRFK